VRRGGAAAAGGLAAALVALATMIQMWIDWHQSEAAGLERISPELKLAVAAAFLLTLTGFILGMASHAARRQ